MSDGAKESAELISRLRDRNAVVMAGLFHAIPAMLDAANEIESIRSQLATAEATYLQFCKKHDEKMAKAIKALEPFAACVFNDNGDVTVETSGIGIEQYYSAYCAMKEIT